MEMPDVELVAIVDKDQAKAESVSKPYHVPAYDNYLEMLEREQPQAVSIVVPTVMHYTVTRDCLEAGCHVLVEKPLAASLEHARELIETAFEGERGQNFIGSRENLLEAAGLRREMRMVSSN